MGKFKGLSVLAIVIMFFAFSASPSHSQTASKADTVKAAVPVAEKVNINKATAEQLMEIKGIGESYAKRIVEYRDKNGPFKKIEDIMQVQGIGEKKFEAIKDLITV